MWANIPATLGALLISLSMGLFGFRESATASYVAVSLAIEAITVVALLAWIVLMATTRPPPTRHPNPSPSKASPAIIPKPSASSTVCLACSTDMTSPAAGMSFPGNRICGQHGSSDAC
jgi:amino acid transporter